MYELTYSPITPRINEELYMNEYYRGSYLAHHGVRGQKWGVRRYQNADGSLTAAGQKRYSGLSGAIAKHYDKKASKWQERSESARTTVGTKFAINRARSRAAKGNYFGGIASESGAGKKVSAALGNRATRNIAQINKEYYKDKGALAKTKLGKAWNNAGHYNSKQTEKYANRTANSKNAHQWIANQLDAQFGPESSKRQNLFGVRMSTGQRFIDTYLLGGLYGTYKSAKNVMTDKEWYNHAD